MLRRSDLSRRAFCLAGVAAAYGRPLDARADSEILVAAASDLQFALSDIAAAFEKSKGTRAKLTFGSSGNLATQIENGAPFELFFSADEAYVERLVAAGLTKGAGAPYAIGRLALFVATASPVKADADLTDLKVALTDGRLKRLAIANPAHAPYGRIAREALQNTGLWSTAESKLVLGDSVTQAAQFALSGNAEAGLIALSLALSPEMKKAGSFAVVSARLHAVLRQRMVLTKNASPEAEAFYSYLQSREAQAILMKFGFEPPLSGT